MKSNCFIALSLSSRGLYRAPYRVPSLDSCRLASAPGRGWPWLALLGLPLGFLVDFLILSLAWIWLRISIGFGWIRLDFCWIWFVSMSGLALVWFLMDSASGFL